MGKIKTKKVPLFTIRRPKKREKGKILKFFPSDLDIGTCTLEKKENLVTEVVIPEESVSQYEERKLREVETWRSLHLPIIQAAVEAECPPSTCTVCHKHWQNIIKCDDCGPQMYFCEDCSVEIHEKVMFHFPRIWQAEQQCFHFTNTVASLVLVHCDCQHHYGKEIIVVDPQGRQHQVHTTFCKCQPEAVSLAASSLWPASPSKPKVAFSFSFLDHIQAIMMECQTSLRGLCEALKWENKRKSFPVFITNLYKVLTGETFEEFRHVRYKQTTCQDVMPNVITGTECPVCPSQHEGKGTAIFSFDGNFGLVRRKKAGTCAKEPNHKGLLFLDQKNVDQFVNSYNGKSTKGCSNFQAGSDAGSKSKNQKLEETAIFGAACRHEFPQMFCSLKFGERLSYPIFLLKKILEQLPSEKTVVMYDIACTLHTHIKKNNDLQHLAEKVAFGIPVFHCHGHRFQCQVLYNPRKMDSVGLTDGETMERLWSYLRRFKKITKEMSSDHRVDLLTDGLLYYASKLRQKLATTLCDKHRRATDSQSQYEIDLQKQLDKASATLSDVTVWSKQQEETAQESTSYSRKKLSSEDWKEDYGFMLHQLQLLSRRKESGDETETLPLQIAQLSVQLSDMEQRHKVKRRWTNEMAHPYFCVASQKKQQVIVANLQKLVLERHSYLQSIRKYADGQSQFLKYSRSLKRVKRNIEKELGRYNSLPKVPNTLPTKFADSLSFQDVIREEVLWPDENPDPSSSSGAKKLCIDLRDLLKRAKEEEDMVKEEMERLLVFDHRLAGNIIALMSQCDSSSDFGQGQRIILKQKLSSVVSTLHENANKFHVFINTEGYQNFCSEFWLTSTLNLPMHTEHEHDESYESSDYESSDESDED